MEETQHQPKSDPLDPLDPERVLDLWSKTYNAQGKPDWSHIFPYYHEEIVFQDTIQRVEGKKDFMAMCNRLTKRCEALSMDITAIASNDHEIFMEWEMTMIFRKTPSTTLYGCTKLTLGSNGQITHQRDYYDLWGDIFVNVPIMKRIYPGFMKRLFG
jgi:limonene-1,2-epoxide hydrolase